MQDLVGQVELARAHAGQKLSKQPQADSASSKVCQDQLDKLQDSLSQGQVIIFTLELYARPLPPGSITVGAKGLGGSFPELPQRCACVRFVNA